MENQKSTPPGGGSQERYMLRQAAGLYWLLDMEQDGMRYQSPLPLNEMGASIFQMITQGVEKEQIADIVSRKYQVETKKALQDIIQFEKQLQEQGIEL